MFAILKAQKARARVAIATELLRNPDSHHMGYELSRAARVGAGRLYPYLTKLMNAGYVMDGWEDPSDTGGRPPRRYYYLTSTGVKALTEFVAEHRVPQTDA